MLIGAGAFTGCKKSGVVTVTPGILTIAIGNEYPPMEYFDADGITPIGFDVEMGKKIASKMGLEPKFINAEWKEIFDDLDANKYDCIISSVTINEARLKAYNFSKPYIQNTLAIVLPKNSGRNVSSPQDLSGLVVSYQAKTTADDFMTDLARRGMWFTPRSYNEMMYCFDELRLGRVDVIVTDLLVAYEYISRPDSPFKIVWQGGEEEFGICMKKGNDSLTRAVNNAIDVLFADGTMIQLSQKIFSMDLVSAVRK